MAAPSSLALKEYLKRYQSGTDESNKAKKKKKKNKEIPKPLSAGAGVIVVDKDPVWQKPVQLDDLHEEDDLAGDETPQVEEDIEVKRMKRLEALRSRKPYHGVSEDGSGWVSIPMPSRASAAAPHQSMEMDEKPADSERDMSPPRRRRRRLDTPSPEPRLSGFEGEVGDLSPPRRRRVDDLSPPRRAKSHRQEEEAGRGLRDGDLSPPRRTRKRSSDDLSPPRRARKSSLESTDVQSSSIPGIKESLLTKEGKMGGLLSGKEMREETDRKRMEEKSRFAAMDPLLTGRGAEAVHRDKEGKRISKEELMKSKEEKKEKKEEKPLEWGKGLAQKREAEERGKELELEKERPFARSRDDPELDKMFKERLRWGDPMAHLVKRKTSELILEDLGENEKMKESGFIVPQTIPSYSWLKRGLDFPPNRYGLKPGRHWDGVDRSNGYEKELFKRQNEKRATETEAYLWSVSDM